MSRVIIGTRGSALARWQADHVAELLRAAHPGLEVAQEIIVTEGDRFQPGSPHASARVGWEASPVPPVAGKEVWVKDIEVALQESRVDLAVHSLKDVPAELAPGLALVAIPKRADARDALVSRNGYTLAELPPGSRVGTSSLRRVCQMRALRPDLLLEVLRGNVDTRLRRVSEGVVDAALLACAGLDRLGYSAKINERLDMESMLPAIGQGALALEARAGDDRVRALAQALSDPTAEATVAAERALLAGLGGSCRTPLAGHALLVRPDRMLVRALVGRPDASEILRARVEGPTTDAVALGTDLAQQLRARGADRILAELG